MRSAHRTKMCGFRSLLRERFIMKFPSRIRIYLKRKLILLPELISRFADGVVAVLGAGMAFGQIGCVRGDFVGDDAVLDVLLVRQTEMFFWGDVAKHGTPIPADHGCAD